MRTAILCLSFVALVVAVPLRKNLQQDFLDFIDLIPIQDLRTVVDKHLRNDLEFQAAIQYFQGPDWDNLVTPVFKATEVGDMRKYLTNSGLNLDLMFAFLEGFMEDVQIKSHHNHPSLKKFLDDVNAVMPHEKLSDMLSEKMETSPHFQDFYDKLSSDRFHKIVESVLALPEVQATLGKVTELDVPVQSTIETLYTFFGWPTPSLPSENIRK